MTEQQRLMELRAKAYAAFDDHQADMKTNPEYRAFVKKNHTDKARV